MDNPPGVSLGVFSLQERHNATYNEHMPNEWTAYSDATSLPRKVPLQSPATGSRRSPYNSANVYILGAGP